MEICAFAAEAVVELRQVAYSLLILGSGVKRTEFENPEPGTRNPEPYFLPGSNLGLVRETFESQSANKRYSSSVRPVTAGMVFFGSACCG